MTAWLRLTSSTRPEPKADPLAPAPAGASGGAPDVVVSLLPAGIRAEIGGFAGDATPATNLLAPTCNHLITKLFPRA